MKSVQRSVIAQTQDSCWVIADKVAKSSSCALSSKLPSWIPQRLKFRRLRPVDPQRAVLVGHGPSFLASPYVELLTIRLAFASSGFKRYNKGLISALITNSADNEAIVNGGKRAGCFIIRRTETAYSPKRYVKWHGSYFFTTTSAHLFFVNKFLLRLVWEFFRVNWIWKWIGEDRTQEGEGRGPNLFHLGL